MDRPTGSARARIGAPFAVLSRDGRLLVATRMARMFAYGFLSVILVLYLVALGFDGLRIGLLLTLTLLGDAAISLWLTTHADHLGRRLVLRIGAALMLGAGVAFAVAGDFWVLTLAATIGVISVTGGEVGPFLAIEQASLSHILPDRERTRIFAWYVLAGSFTTAFGALAAGLLVTFLEARGIGELDAYRAVILGYALVGLVLLVAFGQVSPAVEVPARTDQTIRGRLGLHRSRGIIGRLSGLIALDSFGGALVSQSLVAYWFTVHWGLAPDGLGAIFFVGNILAGLSALVAARLAARIGLIRTMVFTHLPSNVLLVSLPFMPTLALATLVTFLRFSLSQMDVPARQSYIVAVVDPDERSAAAGITGIARSLAAAPAPLIATPLLGIAALSGLPFVLGGSLKITYDLLLYRLFLGVRPPEEDRREPPPTAAPEPALADPAPIGAGRSGTRS
jgi:MFS family permease